MKPERWRQIEEIYHAARERDADNRAAYLDEACADDESLRRDVEALLAANDELDEQTRGFLATPALKLEARSLAEERRWLLAGERISRYRVVSRIGAGGMGEVYLAEDATLSRKVAIKLLPASFAANADLVRRFEQEARAVGMLSHPNILTIFDTGVHQGTPYIVTELLEGENLRALLNDGPLPLRRAMDYARQIIEGLAAAHEKGITHRDLKPENLFVTADGRVKILDFGLAKLRPPKLVGLMNAKADSKTPTQAPQTAPGAVMGTVGYMSPEQVRGQEADHRSDIFAFGIILYEMLTGQRAFQGETFAEVMTAIVKEEPPEITTGNHQIPANLYRVARRCLEKRPERRFQTASDLGFAIEAVSVFSESQQTLALKALPEGEAEKPVAAVFKRERLVWLAVSLLLAAAALISTALYLRKPSPESRGARLSIPLPKGTVTASAVAPDLALSPDGRRLAFSALAGRSRQLWLRPLDSFSAQPLAGTDNADSPFWSPDGRYIAFFADNKLKKFDTRSGVIETICPAGAGRGGDWNRNGVILFCAGDGAALSRVYVAGAAGGKPEAVTELDAARGETNHDYPSFLPDGRHYLVHIFGRDNHGIYVGSLDSKERKLVIPLSPDTANSTRAVWSAPGYILYALNRTTLLAQAFDPDRLELIGEPSRIAENVIVSLTGNARFTASTDGASSVLAFIQSREMDIAQLTWLDRSGKRLGVAGLAEPWTSFELSPDDRLVALIRGEPSRLNSLWLLDLARGATTRFVTDTDSANFFPVWAPNGEHLAFASARNSALNLFLKRTAGNATEERLLETRFQTYPLSWSPDGKFLVFAMGDPQTRTDIWLLPLSGERKPQPLIRTKSDERGARVSPDGRWLAYVSDETGSNEVYVTQFPQPARSWRISGGGGGNPCWRGDGRELFFLSGNKLMAASVVNVAAAEFHVAAPRSIFEIEGANYAPSRDGQRFLTSVVTERAPTPPINVTLNWTAEVER
ncbi:MAG: protein kinase [Blastocatellales bacterium]